MTTPLGHGIDVYPDISTPILQPLNDTPPGLVSSALLGTTRLGATSQALAATHSLRIHSTALAQILVYTLLSTQISEYNGTWSHKPQIALIARSLRRFGTVTLCGRFISVIPRVYGSLLHIFSIGAFWNAPATGTNSKAGTIIHESSHFTANGGTGDLVYGQSGCKLWALLFPNSAVENADSHEYFAENTPALS